MMYDNVAILNITPRLGLSNVFDMKNKKHVTPVHKNAYNLKDSRFTHLNQASPKTDQAVGKTRSLH